MSLWQCTLLLNFCLVFHCELIRRLILCVITRKWIKIWLMAKKANDCGCNNLFISSERCYWIRSNLQFWVNKIERHSGEKLHSSQSLLQWAVQMWYSKFRWTELKLIKSFDTLLTQSKRVTKVGHFSSINCPTSFHHRIRRNQYMFELCNSTD